MSAKTILVPYNVVPPVAGNMGSILQSFPTKVQMEDTIGYSLSWTGTPTGIFTVQCSADYSPGTFPSDYPINAGTWTNITLNAPIVASGSADNGYVDLQLISAPWVRVVYTPSAGTGVLSAWVVGKSLS
jgi:hypothetical protein